ncbi:NADPH:quinone reductase [Candidatus Spongiihabitans sp.]|uniref:NADPH:quinone reductase n=1 Tax=Candidatus Spongiihabitans sp. TaxID=3101308 RepID=UPI003C79F79B
MQAVWYEQQGAAADVLIYGERDMPVVGDGDVLVRLHSSAVNPSDIKKRAGGQAVEFPAGFIIPHSDGAGVIEAVGDGVSENRIGQRVWIYQAQFERHMGSAAEYVAVPSMTAPALPDNIGFDIGACLGIPLMTAHRAVFIQGDVSGLNILVTGASGRVGYYAAQLAKAAGARVIATAGSAARVKVARQTGADEVLNYRADDLAGAIAEFTSGKGVDRIVEVEFGVNAETSAAVLKTGGIISTYSSSLAPQPVIPFYPMMFKNISVSMIMVYNMPETAKQQAILDINRALAKDQLRHRIAQTWSLEQTAIAHEAIEQGGKDGCVVIEMP